jgi:hypothetical protein
VREERSSRPEPAPKREIPKTSASESAQAPLCRKMHCRFLRAHSSCSCSQIPFLQINARMKRLIDLSRDLPAS